MNAPTGATNSPDRCGFSAEVPTGVCRTRIHPVLLPATVGTLSLHA